MVIPLDHLDVRFQKFVPRRSEANASQPPRRCRLPPSIRPERFD